MDIYAIVHTNGGTFNITENEGKYCPLFDNLEYNLQILVEQKDILASKNNIKIDRSYITCKVCIEYMKICALNDEETPGPYIAQLKENIYEAYLIPQEYSLFMSIKQSCNDDNELFIFTLKEILETANFLGMEEFVKKTAAILSLTIIKTTNWSVLNERLPLMKLPDNIIFHDIKSVTCNLLELRPQLDEQINHYIDPVPTDDVLSSSDDEHKQE